MFNRTWLMVFLAGSLALPYAMSQSSGLFDRAWAVVGQSKNESASSPGTATDAPRMGHGSTSATNASHQPPAVAHPPMLQPSAAALQYQSPRPMPLDQVFRFEVTNAWVMGQWPRVSTRLAELDLQGYRVALVSGTQPWDVTGSLTYYFNKQQRVERITFRGTTGDTRPLVTLLCNQHKFTRKLTDDPGLHLYEVVDRGTSISELRIMARSVLQNSDPHNRFQIDLVMNRPSWVK